MIITGLSSTIYKFYNKPVNRICEETRGTTAIDPQHLKVKGKDVSLTN